MRFKKTDTALLLFILFFTVNSTSYAFPPQSIEFMPGYMAPDSASDGGPSADLRYFLHFPSLYLAAGVGIGYVNVPANHQNLAIGSDLEMTPIGFTLRLFPPASESFETFIEIGVDRLNGLHYELDPSIDTGENDLCFPDPATGPGPCRKTTIKKSSLAYRFGAGIKKTFQSGFDVGLHYTFRRAEPISKTVSQTDNLGVQAVQTSREDLFDLKQSIFSILISYRFR
jgi:opacity protein-like surface antigen